MNLLESQTERQRAGIINARGEYAHFMHMFLLRQSDSTEVPHLVEHQWYPWPFTPDVKPCLEHLQAWDHMGGFEHLPQQWNAFWAELGIMRDIAATTRTGPKAANGFPYPDGASYGPYLMVLPFAHEAGLAQLLVKQKNHIRTELLRKGAKPGIVVPYLIQQYLRSLAGYKALTAAQEKEDENSGSGEGSTGLAQVRHGSASGRATRYR